MKKVLGIFSLLLFVCVFTSVLNDGFLSPYNMYNITRWSALFGILSIGVAFVIITSGIDLSIGSLVGLIGCLLPFWLVHGGWPLRWMFDAGWPIWVAMVGVMLVALGVGLLHGLLITKLKLQPFVVTLCGLLFYRGLARWYTSDQTQGFGQSYDDSIRLLATGKPFSVAMLILLFGVLAALWGAWRLIRRRGAWQPTEWLPVFAVAGGIALAAIGWSRFAYGYETAVGKPLFTVGPYLVRTLEVTVPEEGAAMPQWLMKNIGFWVFVPSVLWFVTVGLRARPKKVAYALVALAIAGVMFWFSAVTLAPLYNDVQQNEIWQLGAVTLSGGALRWLVLSAVFVGVGVFMGALAWLATTVLSAAGPHGQAAFVPTLGSGIVWLLGMTPMPATMVPMPMVIMIVMAIVASIFLNNTIYGRYLLALGRNEEAARYSGINTDRMVILAYVICSGAAGLGGILFALDINSVQPSGHGNFYELYAIAAAVLGGCSLRGGEGTILGVVIGAAVMRVLYNSINILGIPTQLEFAIIGVVILAGVIVDELVKRMVARRRART